MQIFAKLVCRSADWATDRGSVQEWLMPATLELGERGLRPRSFGWHRHSMHELLQWIGPELFI